MDTFRRDVRFAVRLVLKTPALSLATIVTLALGIGLNGGVFTVLNGMLLRARVTVDPASFVRLQPVYTGSAPKHESPQFSTADYHALRDRATTVGPLGAWAVIHARVGPEAADGLMLLVSCSFFDAYGLDRMERGRTFRPEECEKAAVPVAVISDEFWRRKLGADPDVLGKPLLLNRQPFVIVGVTPPAFAGRVRGEGIWVPYANQPALMRAQFYDDPARAWLWVEGRLKPGISREAAQAEMNVLMRQQDALAPKRTTAIELTNGAFIHEPQVAPFAVLIIPLVLGSVGLVLLIACGNVTLLLLSRAVARQREIAVRLAIGCSRGRLLRMLLTESVLFAALGVPLSVWMAFEVPQAMRAMIPEMPFYPMDPDLGVFGYLLAVTAAAGLAAGLTPALESLRQRLAPALVGHDAGFGGGRSRSRNVLVAAQIGMSVVLLAGTALLLRVEYALRAADPTVDAAHVLIANYDPSRSMGGPSFQQVAARLAAVPGVRSVAYARGSSGELGGEGVPLSIRGSQAAVRRVAVNAVSSSYFDTLNRRMVEGRPLQPGDSRATVRPLVISEALAHAWWPGGGAPGAVLESADREVFEVVGVVHGDLGLAGGSFDPMQAYAIAADDPPGGLLLLRFAGDLKPLQAAVRDALRDLGPASASLPTTLAAANGEMAARFQPLVDMVGTLGATAIGLALVGIYGVVSFAVGRRTHEIGIRIALGATRADIMRLILSSGVRPIAAGIAGGFVLVVPGAIALGRVFERTPVPLRTGDPLPYLVVAAGLAAAALVTMMVPARRAAAVAPSQSLRSE